MANKGTKPTQNNLKGNNEDKMNKILYDVVMQCMMTNTLAKFPYVKRKTLTADKLQYSEEVEGYFAEQGLYTIIEKNKTGTTVISTKGGNFYATFPTFMTNTGFRPSTSQLLDFLMVEFTEHGGENPHVVFPIKKYMEKKGIDSEESAIKLLKADLNALFDAKISFKTKTKRGDRTYKDIRIISDRKITQDRICISFGYEFYGVVRDCSVMYYPAEIWKTDIQRNPNKYYFLRKLAEHKHLNKGKKNENIISVNSLLESSPNIPLIDEVRAGDRRIYDRIIKPFERDMNAIQSIKWEYGYHDTPKTIITLSQEKVNNRAKKDFETFKNLLIVVKWNNYPVDFVKSRQQDESPL